MAQQLKRWESPRRQGRNIKGKGGAARARQLKKREQQLRRKLKGDGPNQKRNKNQQTEGKEPSKSFPLFLSNISVGLNVRADGAGDAAGRGAILPAIEQNL